MYIVGLTGGIGSGKSEAAKLFAELGVPVVDTDVIAHSLTAAGSPVLQQIALTFGSDYIHQDGNLNRSMLRAHVMGNPDERRKLEEILHPAIHHHALAQLTANEKKLQPRYQVLVIPLLFENRRYEDVINKIIVVDCEESLQIQRAMARSELNEADVRAMMAAQVSRDTRLNGAHEVIKNSGTLNELREKIHKIHNKLIKTCIVSK